MLALCRSPPPSSPSCGFKRERSQESSLTGMGPEPEPGAVDATAVEAAEMLFSLSRCAKRPASAGEMADCAPEEAETSSSASGSSAPAQPAAKRTQLPSTTRSYVWRGPMRRQLGQYTSSSNPAQSLSSDPDDEDVERADAAAPAPKPPSSPVPPASPPSSGDRGDRDKEWAALTTWLRMNLHHPRTTKREVLFLGKHTEGRGWHFFLNPALSWADVSPETKMRLRTLPQETELAFSRKYPNKPPRDWVKKAQKYRPPGSSVTYSVPLTEMIYSLSAIYYQFEGRPGTGALRAAPAAAPVAGAATPAAATTSRAASASASDLTRVADEEAGAAAC